MNTNPPINSPWARAGKAAACLFFTWVALAITLTMVPEDSAPRRMIAPWFDGFRAVTGLEQNWDMFDTVPHYRAYAVTILVEPADKGAAPAARFGPVLPGLREMPANLRYHTFFNRLSPTGQDSHREHYLSRVGEAILEQRPDLRTGSLSVRKTAQRIQALETIRNLGDPAYEETIVHGPYPMSVLTQRKQDD